MQDMSKFMPNGLVELHRWTRADSIMDAYISTQKVSDTGGAAPIDAPLQGEGIGMGSSGVNHMVIELKEEYMEEYGRLTTKQAKGVLKNIFHKSLSERFLEIEEYNDAQLDFALDVAANALVLDYDSFAAQFNRLRPWGMVKAALDLGDVPDADDLHDEIQDGFDDLSPIAKGVVKRYNHVAMGSGGIMPYFENLK